MVRISALISLILSGAIFGFFFAWVCSTLWGLDQIDPRVAIEAMNAMNASVHNAVFFPVFFLTPVATFFTAVFCWVHRLRRSAAWFAAAAVIYVGFAFLPTALVNVPMNELLAAGGVPATVEEARDIWQDYSREWQWWNVFRTIASGISLFLVGLGLMGLKAERGAEG